MSNPNIAEEGRKVGFAKGGGDPRSYKNMPEAHKPWSVKNSLRRLGAVKIKKGDKTAIEEMLGDEYTLPQLAAANALIQASKGDMRALEFVTERIDGKEISINVNADLEHIMAMNDAELDEYNRAVEERIRSLEAQTIEGSFERSDRKTADSQITSGSESSPGDGETPVEPIAWCSDDGIGESGGYNALRGGSGWGEDFSLAGCNIDPSSFGDIPESTPES